MNRAFRSACVSAILLALVGCGQSNFTTLQTITVTSTSASMTRGSTQQLQATGQYSNGTSQPINDQVTWRSSNTAVATVSPSGVVTALTSGTALIAASSGALSGATSIAVQVRLASISISGASSVRRGQTQQLTVLGKYDDGSSGTVTATWTSSDPAVATVAGGVVTGVTMGTSTITATSGGFTAHSAFSVIGIASGTVDSTGGTVTVTGNNPLAGTTVVIPAGAVDAGTTVTINVDYATTPPGPLPPGVTQSSQVIILEKDIPYDFNIPVTVTIPADPAALAAGDVPVVFYWNATYNNYESASLVSIDTTNNTVSFQTVHFSKYLAMSQNGGWAVNNANSVDTSFRPDVDGFFHPNLGSYVTPGGSSMGMSLFSAWYYMDKKAKDGHGLYSKYLEGDVTRWQDDATARELISRTYTASALVWAYVATRSASTLTPAATAQAILTAMSSTNAPQVVILRGVSGWAQAVLVYGWDKDLQRFLVYDPSFRGEAITLGWDSNTGPVAYSKAGAYPDAIQSAELVGLSIALETAEFEPLYAGAEAGFGATLYNQITVNTPALDANHTAVVQDGSALTIAGSISGGSTRATSLMYCINGDCSFAAVALSSDSFSIPLPQLTAATTNIMLIATTEPRNPWTAFAGFAAFTIKVQGKVFFTNAGFETGDWTGWTHETHTWNNPTPGSFTPEKSVIVSATDPDPLVEAYCTGNASCNVSLEKGYVGQWAAQVNNSDYDYHISTVSQTVTVPNIANPQVRFYWAAVLEDPGHPPEAQPYVDIVVLDVTTNTELYRKHFYSNDPAYSGWKTIYPNYSTWQVIEWQPIIVQGVAGHQITVTITAADCGYGGHGGYAYLDGDEN